MEHSLESRLSQEVADVDGGRKELGVVDHFVSVVVHLSDDVVDFLATDVHASLQKNLLQLIRFNETCAIYINLLEGSTQLLYLLLASRLDEQVHSGLLERRNAFEASKSLQDVIADFTVVDTIRIASCRRLGSLVCHYFEPGVVQGVLSTDALALFDDEKFFYQVLALFAYLVELSVLEVILCAANLAEDFGGVFALERKVATHQGVQDDAE